MSEEYTGKLTGTPELDECAACGRLFTKRDLVVEEDAAAEGDRSAYRELCPDCLKLELAGELLPPPEEEHAAPAAAV